MTSWPCPNPAFTWNHAAHAWSFCTACGRLAWDHEQADPLQDLRAVAFWAYHDMPAWMYPPAMKSDQDQHRGE